MAGLRYDPLEDITVQLFCMPLAPPPGYRIKTHCRNRARPVIIHAVPSGRLTGITLILFITAIKGNSPPWKILF